MNRRDFVKTLAGIGVLFNPLTRWFSWWPKTEEELELIVPSDTDEELFETAYADLRSGAVQQPALELQIESYGQRRWSITIDGVDVSDQVTAFEVTMSTGIDLEYDRSGRGPWI